MHETLRWKLIAISSSVRGFVPYDMQTMYNASSLYDSGLAGTGMARHTYLTDMRSGKDKFVTDGYALDWHVKP